MVERRPGLSPPFHAGPVLGVAVEGRFGHQVRRGLRWSFVTQIAARAVSFASGIALFRLLRPDAFGVYALALGVVGILMSANDLGQIVAVMRWPGDHREVTPTATTLTIAASATVYAGLFVVAPLLARSADRPGAAGVLRLLALIVLVDGVTATPRSLLLRTFRPDRLAAGELAGVPLNLVLSLGLAWSGAGAWAPAVGAVAGALVNGAVVLWLAPEVPVPGWDRGIAGHLLAFGLPLAGTTLVELTLLNVDYLLVGSLLGATALGFYALAFNVSSWPATVITQAVRRVSIVSFATLSADDDPPELQRSFVRSATLLATVLVPICVGLSVLAGPLIEVVYSEKGRPAIAALTWLAVLGGVRVAVGFVFDLLAGTGRSRAAFGVQALWLGAVVPALYLGARLDGIRGVAVAHVIVAVGVAAPAFALALRRAGVALRVLGRALSRPLLGGALAAVVAVVVRESVAGALCRVLAGGLALIATYVVTVVPVEAVRRLGRAGRGVPSA